MDAVAFPPPPAPFLDDDLDFGDFAFASPPAPAPQPGPAAFAAFDDDWGDFVAGGPGSSADPAEPPASDSAAAAPASWEKPRGPLPLSLFGADDDDDQEGVGPAGPEAPGAGLQQAPSFPTDNGSRPGDLKDLLAGLYGSQPPPAAGPADAGAQGDEEFGGDDWEFTAATPGPADQGGGGEVIVKVEEGEGPARPEQPATGHQQALSFTTDASRPVDLKDLIAGFYGSQPPPAAAPADAGAQEEAQGDEEFGGDDWEFTAATLGSADQDGGRHGSGDGTGKVEDIRKSLSTEQEDWSSFTSVDEKMNHVHQSTNTIQTQESTGECVKASTYSPDNKSAILNLYKESERADAIHIAQSSAESVHSSPDLFYKNEVKSSFQTDENHSSRSTSDGVLIEFYHRLREESLTVISHHVKDLRDAQKVSKHPDENSKVTEIGKEIQEIYNKLKDSSLPEGFCTEEHPSKDLCITELLNYIREEHLKDFEQEYCLAEKIAQAIEDKDIAVELYKHSVSTLDVLKLSSKEEHGDYIAAWYSMLLACAQELQHGAALWQESYHAHVCDRLISEGGHYFIALGEIYRVAQLLYFSLQRFKPWVLAVPGTLSKMLSCLDSCTIAWNNGLETALKMVVDSKLMAKSDPLALMESIKNITDLKVPNLQKTIPNNEMQCRLTLMPTSLVPGLKVVMWNGDHCFVKVANLWANRISPDPPQFSCNAASAMNKAAILANHVEQHITPPVTNV